MALRGIPRLASLPTAIGNWAEQLDKAAPGVLPWLQDFFASVFREFKDLRSRVGALESVSVATTNTTHYSLSADLTRSATRLIDGARRARAALAATVGARAVVARAAARGAAAAVAAASSAASQTVGVAQQAGPPAARGREAGEDEQGRAQEVEQTDRGPARRPRRHRGAPCRPRSDRVFSEVSSVHATPRQAG